jgi:dTDP-glucose 4,6-dehydratase
VKEILRLLGKGEDLIHYVKDRPGHDRRYAMDSSKARATLGWTPVYTFESGLRDTVAWYQQNRAWWERVRSGAYQDYYMQQYGGR